MLSRRRRPPCTLPPQKGKEQRCHQLNRSATDWSRWWTGRPRKSRNETKVNATLRTCSQRTVSNLTRDHTGDQTKPGSDITLGRACAISPSPSKLCRRLLYLQTNKYVQHKIIGRASVTADIRVCPAFWYTCPHKSGGPYRHLPLDTINQHQNYYSSLSPTRRTLENEDTVQMVNHLTTQ